MKRLSPNSPHRVFIGAQLASYKAMVSWFRYQYERSHVFQAGFSCWPWLRAPGWAMGPLASPRGILVTTVRGFHGYILGFHPSRVVGRPTIFGELIDSEQRASQRERNSSLTPTLSPSTLRSPSYPSVSLTLYPLFPFPSLFITPLEIVDMICHGGVILETTKS